VRRLHEAADGTRAADAAFHESRQELAAPHDEVVDAVSASAGLNAKAEAIRHALAEVAGLRAAVDARIGGRRPSPAASGWGRSCSRSQRPRPAPGL